MFRILLDTDPGIDDALALFLALASPDMRLEGITTVSGNVHVDLTTRNALALLELAGRADIPVSRGCDRPMVRQPVIADYVHGRNGLGEVSLPAARQPPAAMHAVDFLIEKILSAPGEMTLVPIGPLTNIALAVRREPRIAQLVREVVIMGGALRVPGNVTPASEFNIYADPEAAHVVLHAGWPVRLVPLDATRQALLTREQTRALAAGGHPVTRLIQQMVLYYLDVYAGPRGITSFTMHDPLCLAAALRPDLLTWQAAYVDVELRGSLTLGETVAYFERLEDVDPALEGAHRANVQAAVAVDVEQFLAFYVERIQAAFG